MTKLYAVTSRRIGGLHLDGGDPSATPGTRYMSRSLERFFIRKTPWQVKNQSVLKSLRA